MEKYWAKVFEIGNNTPNNNLLRIHRLPIKKLSQFVYGLIHKFII